MQLRNHSHCYGLPAILLHWVMAILIIGLFYVLIAAVVVSGYLIPAADGEALSVFNWFDVPASIQGVENQADIAGEVHEWLAYSFIVLIVLHTKVLAHYLIRHYRKKPVKCSKTLSASAWMLLRPGWRTPRLLWATFTVADAYLFTVLSWSPHISFDLGRWPILETYLERVSARPTVNKALAEEGLLAE